MNQTTVTFHYDAAIGNVEITATVMPLGTVVFNAIRRNSDLRRTDLTAWERKDAANLARWYAEDEVA